MNIHEYQSKALLADYGVSVPSGTNVSDLESAKRAAAEYGGRVVVKAQVHAGGRGEAGGVKVVTDEQAAKEAAEKMLDTRLVTKQTTSDGVPVQSVLIEELIDIKRELYLSLLVDGDTGRVVIVSSTEGGMAIERLAEERPDKICRTYAEPDIGLSPYRVRDLAISLGVPAELRRAFSALVLNLYRAFTELDCTLIELNPLVITGDGRLLAADAKIDIEDDALFRHQELLELRDDGQLGSLERLARAQDLAYVKLSDGQVGCMVNGAGLAMATMDTTLRAGTKPANFLDIGGSANLERIEEAVRIVLSDTDVKVVLLNLFAGIARADIVAQGIVSTYATAEHAPPLVVVMRGTNADAGKEILETASLPVHFATNLTEATALINKILEA